MHSRRKSLFLRWLRPTLVWCALLATAGGAAWLAYGFSERNGYERLDDAAARQLDLYAAVLENELGKHAYLPALIELDQDIAALLHAPDDAVLRETVSRKLARFTVQAGALVSLVLDARGRVVGASDWYRPGSLIGQDLSARPFFADAMRGEPGRFFTANVERGAPEYTFSQPLVRDRQVQGAVVVRISLEPMESTWVDSAVRVDSEKPLVVDEHGVVIIASNPHWKFKATTPLAEAERQRLSTLGAYAGRTIEPLGMRIEGPLEHGAQLVRLPGPAPGRSALYVLHERPIARFNWRLLSLSDASEVWRTASLAAWSAGAITAFVGLFLLYQLQRRRVIAQKLAARAALQAGKLAALGQMSASVSHEIGQPLTALRALSENARLLLDRGKTADVAENLVAITGLVERMGRITAQLKSFARKAPAPAGPVPLAGAVANAQQLLQARLRAEQIDVVVDLPADLQVHCDGYRLEQVLVNLMANAIDAMHDSETRRLTVSAQLADGGRVKVRVSDTGPGIPPSRRERLFEPFFTTKPVNEGLGLGLAISANIVHEFGGELRAVDTAQGAAFEFDLGQHTR